MTTIKAVRATITLGDIELDVFQLPDGSYHFTQSVLKTIHITLSDTSGKKYVKPILEANSALLQTAQLEGNPVKLKLIPMSLFGEIVGIYAKLGNEYCIAILVACFTEALERRADAAFGILKAEEDRNIWFAQRLNSKLYRRPFTDKLADENARNGNKTNYGWATLRVYKRAKVSEKYNAWKCLPDTKIGFRDTLTMEELASVIRVEDMIVNIMNLRQCTFDDAMEFFKQSFEQ